MQLPFDSPRRTTWHYVPGSRPGIPIGDLNATQRKALEQLLRTALSDQGLTKVKGVIELEPILGRLERSSFRDPDRYSIALFGDAGWKFEGHHLSINATFAGNERSVTPSFLGANPATVPDGPRRGWRVLGAEEDLGRELLKSLSAAQRAEAVISTRAPRDIITGVARQVSLQRFEGLPASKMNTAQRELMMRLVQAYVGNASTDVVKRETEMLRAAGIEKVHFAWAGGSEPGQPHYYRVHGPTILIEYDNTQDGANHIHSVWRTPGRDFGDDLLKKHYATGHHSKPQTANR